MAIPAPAWITWRNSRRACRPIRTSAASRRCSSSSRCWPHRTPRAVVATGRIWRRRTGSGQGRRGDQLNKPRPPVEPYPPPPTRIGQELEEAMQDLEHAKAQRAQRAFEAQVAQFYGGARIGGAQQQPQVDSDLIQRLDALQRSVAEVYEISLCILQLLQKLGEPRVVEFPASALRHGSPR